MLMMLNRVGASQCLFCVRPVADQSHFFVKVNKTRAALHFEWDLNISYSNSIWPDSANYGRAKRLKYSKARQRSDSELPLIAPVAA
jgi:hypothetical protein